MTAIAAAALTAALPYLITLAGGAAMTGLGWVFTKWVPTKIALIHNTKVASWAAVANQAAGSLVLAMAKPAIDAGSAAAAGGPKAAGMAALGVLTDGLKAKLGPTQLALMEKEFGDDLDLFLQHVLVGAAATNAVAAGDTTVNGQEVKKQADVLAEHLNALTT